MSDSFIVKYYESTTDRVECGLIGSAEMCEATVRQARASGLRCWYEPYTLSVLPECRASDERINRG